jgi:endonuclease/exonuclease/phosphatase family metal-dependent hydrolase
VTGLRVATYNLLHGLDIRAGRVDLGAVAAAIEALDADVVAVQEVDRDQPRSGRVDQVAELAGRLGRHGRFAPALLGDPSLRWEVGPGDGADPGGPAYGIGLLSRLPLTDVTPVILPGGGPGERVPVDPPARLPGWDGEPRAALRAAVHHAGEEVTLTTAHLSYLPWRGVRQLLAATEFAAERGGPAVLLGDLNLPLRALAAVLTGTGWRVTPAEATFPSWGPGVQIDHVLVFGGLVATQVAVGPRGPSDHLPLGATLHRG